MGVQWAGDRPRVVPDHDGPRTRDEIVSTILIVLAIAVALIGVGWRGHAVQTHLDRQCAAGDPVACRLDGRP